jgi:hypothetical protein
MDDKKMATKWLMRRQFLYDVHNHLIFNGFFAYNKITKLGTKNA